LGEMISNLPTIFIPFVYLLLGHYIFLKENSTILMLAIINKMTQLFGLANFPTPIHSHIHIPFLLGFFFK
jgi:hypothetical protein